jgi:hypothetical protein
MKTRVRLVGRSVHPLHCGEHVPVVLPCVSRGLTVVLLLFVVELQGQRRISSGENAAFGFTESDEVIPLRHDGELNAVTSSKRPWRVTVRRDELATAFSGFIREAHSRLSEVPGLVANPVIAQMSRA